MTSEGTIIGRNGKFQIGTALVARITSWEANPTLASTTEWGDSDTGGYTARAAGRKDCTFSAEGKYEGTDVVWTVFDIGDTLSCSLWLTASLSYWFPRALCTGFTISVDVDGEEVVGWTSEWGADGIFYDPSVVIAGRPTLGS